MNLFPRISLGRVLTLAAFGAILLFGNAARADDLDDVKLDGTETAQQTAPAPRRDPSEAGRLNGRRNVDLAFADDDAGHRFEVVRPAPAPRHHRRHGRRHHRNDSADATPTFR